MEKMSTIPTTNIRSSENIKVISISSNQKRNYKKHDSCIFKSLSDIFHDLIKEIHIIKKNTYYKMKVNSKLDKFPKILKPYKTIKEVPTMVSSSESLKNSINDDIHDGSFKMTDKTKNLNDVENKAISTTQTLPIFTSKTHADQAIFNVKMASESEKVGNDTNKEDSNSDIFLKLFFWVDLLPIFKYAEKMLSIGESENDLD